ncbi:MerR family transcriptional regulator [Thermoactinomyces sp. DSM 45892]|uniref:MerR family transcriptional regulator n=1 Tax=Thermoactinomyces sp. DSM 45892 TaxID=1882753 RepID=UPI00089A24C7|nr:MerR family transcriptional regulator [Thermoactinomyces sp. DSM 45892]SDY99218.1 MerR family transcriptional regulator, glutamine synthetase repressor [Thermoactinomyces sp. DSM 45892]
MNDEMRRNMPLFPIGTVTKLTDLTPRQVRYYEQQGLIQPERTNGNQRLFSFNDVERLFEIKSLIEKGVNLAGVKEMLQKDHQILEAHKEVEKAKAAVVKVKQELSERELRRLLKRDLLHPKLGRTSEVYGEFSRFFRQ